jgi:hypothetical protein
MGKRYSEEEEELMRRVYPDNGMEYLQTLLPKRSRCSLGTKLREMGVVLTKEARAEIAKRSGEKLAKKYPSKKKNKPKKSYSLEHGYGYIENENERRVSSIFDIGQRFING